MKKGVALAAFVAFAFASTGVLAQNAEMYVTKGTGDTWTFHSGTAGAEGTEVLSAESGTKPADCPAGSYWLNSAQMLVGCEDDKEFGFGEITEGQKTTSGEDFPENSYLVQEGGKPMSEFNP